MTADGQDGVVVVLSFNTLDVVSAHDLFDLVEAHHADVVVLPETSRHTGLKVAALMAQTGHPMRCLRGQEELAQRRR